MTHHNRHNYSKLPDLIGALKPHDHLCLIYESREEWLETIVPFILSGLERGEKCIYVVDANTAQEIKAIFIETGLAVDEYERKGQFSVIHERDAYTREGSFDPDLMIALLISETEKALREGYSALRVTGEMSWALRGYSGAERVLEYEAKLNRDLFPAYPCVSICQYDRWKFDPETIKGVVLTHPLLIRGGQIYRNFYYIEPEEYLNHKKGEREVQHWLNNLERERKTLESLLESEAFARAVMDNLPIGLAVNSVDPEVNFTYMNDNFPRIYHTTREALADRDAFWDVVYEDPKFRSEIKKRVLEDCASGNPEKMLWENIPLTRNGKVVAYISASNTPVPNKGLMISTVWDVTNRKKAEEDLHEINEYLNFYRLAVDNMENYKVAVVDDNYRYRIVSRQYLEGYNLTKADLVGKAVAELMGTEIFESNVKPNLDRALKGQVVNYANWFDIPAKGKRFMEVSYYPIPGEDHAVSSVAAISRDVTEQKKAEETLRRREEEFRALAENAPDIVVRFDRELRHLYVNPALEKEMGIPREQFIGKTHSELGWPPEAAKARAAILQEVFDTTQEKTHYFEYKTPEGWKYYHSRNVPEFAPDGSVETVLAITRDISAIKKMEAALYQEKLKTQQLHRRALPDHLPKMPGLTLAASYIPAATLQGDYCNVIKRRNQLLLYLVDVDKSRDDGVMQSLYVRKAIDDYLQAHAEDAPVSPALLLRYLQGRFQLDNQDETAPLCVLIGVFEKQVAAENADNYCPETLRYASTGFCTPPLLIKGSGNPDGFALKNLSLPMGEGTESMEHSLNIAPGSTFVFSTDGLFNQGPDAGSYELRLRELLNKRAHLPPEMINQAVENDFTEFYSDCPLQNDLALIVVQVPRREQCLSFKLESEFQQISYAKEKVSSLLHKALGEEPNLLHLHELLVNAVEHGNKLDGGKNVAIDLIVTDRYYKAVITDQGEGFNWREKINRELDLEGDSERGRGIIMTRMMTDYLGYNERGNRVIMINLFK